MFLCIKQKGGKKLFFLKSGIEFKTFYAVTPIWHLFAIVVQFT